MRVFHAEHHRATERGTRALARLTEQLEGLRTRREVAAEGFEPFEREVHALFVEAEREVLEEKLEALDLDLPYVEIDGRRHHRVLRGPQTYTTAVGPTRVARTLYRCGGERAVVAMELRAGIIEGCWMKRSRRRFKGMSRILSREQEDSTAGSRPLMSGLAS